MRKIPLLLVSLLTLPVHAQDIMSALFEHRPTRSSSSAGLQSGPSVPDIGTSVSKSAVEGQSCADLGMNENSSLPLKVITSLIQAEPRILKLDHDPATGTLKISSPDMIGNCSRMVEWKVHQTAVEGANAYVVEAKIKEGSDCRHGVCQYRVSVVENGTFKNHEIMSFKPNLSGFKECLEKSGAFKREGDKFQVNTTGIYYEPVNEKFQDIKETGKVLFMSEGPHSYQIGTASGEKFELVSDCKHYEKVSPDQVELLSEADQTKRRLAEEAAKLADCPADEYHRVADFLDTYGDVNNQLTAIRDNLIKKAAQDAAKRISEGTDTEDDRKLIEDFDKYIVQPKIQEAEAIFAQLEAATGAERENLQKELREKLTELAAFGNKPYFQRDHVSKLINDGRFHDAEKLNSLKLTIETYMLLGKKDGNETITPEVVKRSINNQKTLFTSELEKQRERYELRTGQTTGMAQAYSQLSQRVSQNIQVRTRNYQQAIAEKYQEIQPGGYCYRYFRNTQRCIQEALESIQALQHALTTNNEIDRKRAEEYQQKAQEYQKLEAEGRRYVAAQNGEEVPAETEEDNLTPDPGVYSFNFDPRAAGAQQPGMPQGMQPGMPQGMVPGMQQGFYPQQQPQGFMNPVMPYQNMYQQQYPQMYQQPFMGQTGAFAQFGLQGGMNPMMMGMQQPMMAGMQQPAGMGGGYNFNWNGGQMYGQQPGFGQPMYGQPMMGMQYPSMYGQPRPF